MSNALAPIPPHAPGLISREMDGEIVVMDEQSQQVHLLKDVSAQVWHAAAGGPAPTASAVEVEAAVAEMTAAGLLQQAPGMSRRSLLRSATVVAGVGITTMALPPAIAMASSSVATKVTLSVASTMVRNSTGNLATGTVLRSATNEPVAGVTVTVYAQKLLGNGNDTGTAINLGSAVTGSDGSYSLSYTAPAQGNYRFYAVVTATLTYATSTSANSSVTVT